MMELDLFLLLQPACRPVINELSCGVKAWPPYIFDITDALQNGANIVEVRVTNTLGNQWARKEIRQNDFALWKNTYLETATPFIDQSCHAGLAGPLSLRTYRSMLEQPDMAVTPA